MILVGGSAHSAHVHQASDIIALKRLSEVDDGDVGDVNDAQL